jgi:hypothetical protein
MLVKYVEDQCRHRPIIAGDCEETRGKLSSFSKLQNIPELKVGQAKSFNFSPKTYKLPNSISRDSGDSPDSNHTKYVNYGYEIREKYLFYPLK